MFEDKKLDVWSKSYWNHIKRNIGIVSNDEQEQIRNTPIAILGLGGLGGPLSEQLARIGCEKLLIYDNDIFTSSNLNRQICTKEDLDKSKISFTEKLLKKINPEVNIRKYNKLDELNISKILENISIVALTLDDPLRSIIIARECEKQNIPIIESFGIPYLWSWWFNRKSIDYETCYDFKTKKLKISEMKKHSKELLDIKKTVLPKLLQFPGLNDIYNRKLKSMDGMISGQLPFVTFAPITRLTSSYMAFDIIYSGILKIKKKILAPNILGYDYYRMREIKFRVK
ncbi:MAG: ThiF family adenylyltransferase [Promethearchaeati archaeon]